MAIAVNKNTTQTPMTATGQTGVQSVRFIPASRVYIKITPDSMTAAPVNLMAAYTMKSNGVTPATNGTWLDLGTMDDQGKITYTKSVKKVQTGLDKVTQAIYIGEKTAQLEFNLSQLDDYLLTQLGFITSTITAGSSQNFQIGQEDVVGVALLLVSQNKLDSKEIQFYHPNAQVSVALDSKTDQTGVKMTCECIAFTPAGYSNGRQSLLSATVFA